MTKYIQLWLSLFLLTMTCCTEAQIDPSDNPQEDPKLENLCEFIDHNDETGEDLDEAIELLALEDIYEKFENYVREKSADGLNSILLHHLIPLFITGKEPSGIKSIVLDGPGFENYIVGDPNPHELRITNTEFTILKGAAVSWANYEEVINSNTVGTGIDLFFYIKTNEGWKIATTNNTYILQGDNTDYEITSPMPETPKPAFDKMIEAFNEKDKSKFISTFKNEASFFVLSSQLTEIFSESIHTPSAFIDCISNDENSYSLSVSNETIEIKDQYLAKVIADYSISTSSDEIESGKMVLTMIGTPNGGWKISAMALTY